MGNKWMNRDGGRATSEVIMRNTYRQFGIQFYVAVEGESDIKFFSNIISNKVCKIISLNGRDKVINFITKQNSQKKKGCLGIIDADFTNLTKSCFSIENLIQIDFHDVEMLIIHQTSDYRKLYSEYGDLNLIDEAEKRFKKTFINKILEAAYKIGVMKFTVESNKYNDISMKDLPYADIINSEFIVDIDLLVDRIKLRHSKSEMIEEYKINLSQNYDQWQVCCGHDVANILTLAFMTKENGGLGYGNNIRLVKERLESTLRSIYSYGNFIYTHIYRDIIKWQEEQGITILFKEFITAVA